MFSEEVGDFGLFAPDGRIKWCFTIIILHIHICTFGNDQFADFLVTIGSRNMQTRPWVVSTYSTLCLLVLKKNLSPITVLHVFGVDAV